MSLKRPLRYFQVDALEKAIAGYEGEVPEEGGPYTKQMIVLPTGAGKTVCFAAAADYCIEQWSKPVLVLVDQLDLVDQARDEILDFTSLYPQVEQGDRTASLAAPVVCATVQSMAHRLEKFPANHFGLVIADECDRCFPFNTLIATSEGPMLIGDIVEGRKELAIASCNLQTGEIEWRPITRHWKNKAKPLLKITHEFGSFTCTRNHKIWTEDGYVWAENLVAGSRLRVLPSAIQANARVLETTKDVQQGMCRPIHSVQSGSSSKITHKPHAPAHRIYLPTMRKAVRGAAKAIGKAAQILQREMQSPRELGSARQVRISDKGAKSVCDRADREAGKQGGFVAHDNGQPDAQSEAQSENGRQGERSNISVPWWQRQDYGSTASVVRGTGVADGSRNCNSRRQGAIQIATRQLQSGHSVPGNPAGDRSGWPHAHEREMEVSRSPQDGCFECSRVVGIEVLESGDQSGFGGRGGENSSLYDIEVEANHNYFAEGVLVSNSVAPIWQKVLNHFDAHAKVLGVTATPDRGDQRCVLDYYERIAHEVALFDLVKEGYLSKIMVQNVPIEIDISGIKQTAGDYDKDELDAALVPYFDKVCEALLEYAPNRKTLVFLPLIATSKKFVDIAISHGIRAKHVDGADAERDLIKGQFRSREIDLLSNAMLLGRGYNDRSIDCIDAATEVLTPDGWRGIDDEIRDVVSFNEKDRKLEKQPVTGRVKKTYSGECVELRGGDYDLRLTPNHRMLVGTGRAHQPPRLWTTARELDQLNRFRLPTSGKGKRQPGVALSDDELRFIAWFLTDGGWHRYPNQVSICQAKPEEINRIRELLHRLNLRFWEYTSNNRNGYGSESAMELHRFILPKGVKGAAKGKGWAHLHKYLDKHFAPELLKMNRRQFAVFWEELLRGDGVGENKLIVCDDRLLAALQAIAAITGHSTNAYIVQTLSDGSKAWVLRVHDREFVGVRVNHRARNFSAITKTSCDNERFWCLENANSTLVVRRNGKVAIVGNCIVNLRPTRSGPLYRQFVGRGTRTYCPHGCPQRCDHPDAKQNLLLLDFLWTHHKLGLQRPANLIAKTADQANRLTKYSERANGRILDLEGIDSKVALEAEKALLDSLMRGRKRRPGYFDAMEVAAALHQRELMEYQPMARWEKKPATERQLAALAKMGFNPESVENLGMAVKIFNLANERRMEGLATFKQLKHLRRYKIEDAENVTFTGATAILNEQFNGEAIPEGTQIYKQAGDHCSPADQEAAASEEPPPEILQASASGVASPPASVNMAGTAPGADDNLPVPVLAESSVGSPARSLTQSIDCAEARESISRPDGSGAESVADSRGGQFISAERAAQRRARPTDDDTSRPAPAPLRPDIAAFRKPADSYQGVSAKQRDFIADMFAEMKAAVAAVPDQK